MKQNAVAVPHPARGKSGGGGLDPRLEVGPGPGPVAPYLRWAVGEPPRRLDQEMREIGGRNQRSGSRMDT
jgi:hypothetical protein